MRLTTRDLLDLPPLLDIWDDEPHTVPTAGELLEVRTRPTAYRQAKDWPTIRYGNRLRVQTVPFVLHYLGVDLVRVASSETDTKEPPALSPLKIA